MPDSRRTRRAAVVLCLLVAAPAVAGPSKVPARLAQARYVALAYDLGDVLLSESESVSKPGRVLPEDREALNGVRSQLEKWGRYVLTLRPAEADLLIAVRSGRRASAEASVRVGGRREGSAPAGSVATGGSLKVEASSGADLLSVYDTAGGGSVVLWREQRHGGLSGPSPALFEDFKADVERAARRP